MIFSDCCGTSNRNRKKICKEHFYAENAKWKIDFMHAERSEYDWSFFARNVERNKYDINVNVKRIISISFNIILDNPILKGADYIESLEPGLSFIPVSRAEISARPKDKILLKQSKRLHDQNSSPGLKFQPGLSWNFRLLKFQPGLSFSLAACNRK
jgi:hypothetical protein